MTKRAPRRLSTALSRHLATRKPVGSEHEQAALAVIRAMGLPEPAREYQFAGHRRWRFDLCWPCVPGRDGFGQRCDRRIAVEVEGGQWSKSTYRNKRGEIVTRIGGRHNTPQGMQDDAEKYSWAAVFGWTVIRVTPQMIRDGTLRELLERVFEKERP